MTTPEAIETAARAMFYQQVGLKPPYPLWDDADAIEKDNCRNDAQLALSAAYPFIAAEVLRDTAKDFAEGEWIDALTAAENDVETVVAVDEWLNHRAATIESEPTP